MSRECSALNLALPKSKDKQADMEKAYLAWSAPGGGSVDFFAGRLPPLLQPYSDCFEDYDCRMPNLTAVISVWEGKASRPWCHTMFLLCAQHIQWRDCQYMSTSVHMQPCLTLASHMYGYSMATRAGLWLPTCQVRDSMPTYLIACMPVCLHASQPPD
jgi:hypothetical protein